MFDRSEFYIILGATIVGLIPIVMMNYFSESANSSTTKNSKGNSKTMEALMDELKNNPTDPNSFARPEEAKVDNIHLDLKIDFSKTRFTGTVKLNCTKVDSKVNFLTLDSLDLNVTNVCDENGKPLAFEVFPSVPEFGSKIQIDISAVTVKRFSVVLKYKTSSNARGLQWLDKQQSQTDIPFMFSQFEAINARSFLPCQDTPSVKASYTADIESDAIFTVLMSAISSEPVLTSNGKKIHKFLQKVPIPSYLIAIAAGQIEHRKLGPRSSVWAVPKLIEKSAWEFAELDKILRTAEELAGPYVFQQYDLLVLPPSFPFGGMENPCLTFVTPTLLAGDRSLVNVVAHEIAHSWTGNLVTNKNFEHFWLNEGFTTFLERKIIGRMDKNGEKLRHFAAIEGLKELNDSIKTMGTTNALTKLVTNLKGINPDDAFSYVPYEKGHTFLFYLEQLFGGPGVFEPFLRSYIQKFKYRSIETNDFKDYFLEYFKTNQEGLKKVDWDSWLYTPGSPLHIPKYDGALLDASVKLASNWMNVTDDIAKNISQLDIKFPLKEWKELESGQKKLFFVELQERSVEKKLSSVVLDAINSHYLMNKEHNAEVLSVWIILGLQSHYENIVNRSLQFVTEIGRMKFIRPIYRSLYAWEAKRQIAIDTFLKNKPNMMSLSVAGVETDLHLKSA